MKSRPVLIVAALFSLAVSLGAAASRPTATTTAPPPPGPPPGIARVKLWTVTPGVVAGNDTDADPTEPTMDIYLPSAERATGVGMLVLPGGSYSNLAIGKEGTAAAQMLLSHNIAAFVVRYRHGPRYHHPAPLLDAQRAIRTVRAKAAEFHVDPKRIGIMGFSAGGHLAASTAVFFADPPAPPSPDAIDKENPRPDFAVLMYPVINLTDEPIVHQRSRAALTAGDPALYPALSLDQHVSKDTPPIFLAAGTDDRVVPVMNSVLFYEACLKAKVSVEMHIFEVGPHGFGLGIDPATRTWPDLYFKWMERHKWLTPAAQ